MLFRSLNVLIVSPGTKHYGLASCQVISIANSASWTHGCGQLALFMVRLADGTPSERLMTYLHGLQFPAKKDDIVHAARKNGAPNEVIAVLSELTRNEFGSAAELIEAYPPMT